MNAIPTYRTFTGRAALLSLAIPTLSHAALTHRWSFNGDLTDSVGGQTAQILDPDSNAGTGGGSSLSASAVTLIGGGNLDSDYVELGAGAMGNTGSTTLEMWTTLNGVAGGWSRIFDFGNGTPDEANSNFLHMSFYTGTDLNTDRVEYRLSDLAPGGNQGVSLDNTNAPYTVGTEFHVAMTLQNLGPGNTLVTWYSAPAGAPSLGPAKGSFTSTIDPNEFANDASWLGRSHWDGDATASATYNEFRIYNDALPAVSLEANHAAGADGVVVPEPSAVALLGLSSLGLLARRRRD